MWGGGRGVTPQKEQDHLIGTITFRPSAQRMSTASRFSFFLMRLITDISKKSTFFFQKTIYTCQWCSISFLHWSNFLWSNNVRLVQHQYIVNIIDRAENSLLKNHLTSRIDYLEVFLCILCNWLYLRPPHGKVTWWMQCGYRRYYNQVQSHQWLNLAPQSISNWIGRH